MVIADGKYPSAAYAGRLVKTAVAIEAPGDTDLYADIIFKKGVIT